MVVSVSVFSYLRIPILTCVGDVGVGGFTLGGGLSFMSAAHGFACDNVVNYEVVLANASIVNANENENRDLFWALKGGGNQFGMNHPCSSKLARCFLHTTQELLLVST